MSKNSEPKKVGQCAYCGKRCRVTDDHIPPKNLFPKPRSSNLVTVPCCEGCREGWSKDDEYFRAVVLSAEKVSEQSSAKSSIDSLMRSLYRPEQKRFALMLTGSVTEIEVLTKAGIYLRTAPAIKIDTKRIDRVGERIIRGLFFHEKNRPIPKGYKVVAKIYQFGINPVAKILEGVQFHELRVIQNGIFRYTFQDTDEDSNSGIWFLQLFESLDIVGYIMPEKWLSIPNQRK